MDLYAVLGVPKKATPAQIRRAYRIQVVVSHPDLHGTPAERRMVELNLAAFVLLDGPRRAEYDRHRFGEDAAPVPKSKETPVEHFYPWSSSPDVHQTDRKAQEEWISPPTPYRPRAVDAELGSLAARMRERPSRVFQNLACWSTNCSPTTHLLVAFTSICLALLLIASARPTSLTNLYERSDSLACVATSPDGG